MAADPIEARIADYVDGHAEDMVDFLSEVVAIPSVWGELTELHRLAETLGGRLQAAGATVDYPDSGTAGAPNMLAHVGSQSADRCFLLCGHMDVYPPSKKLVA